MASFCQIPSISLADVHAVLAYYYDHIDEIREEMREEATRSDEFRREHPSLVEAKLGRDRLKVS